MREERIDCDQCGPAELSDDLSANDEGGECTMDRRAERCEDQEGL